MNNQQQARALKVLEELNRSLRDIAKALTIITDMMEQEIEHEQRKQH